MSAMAAAPPPRLDSVLSFGTALPAGAEAGRPATDEADALAFSDASSDYDDGDSDAGFEFAFAPPLAARGSGAPDLAPADDLFAHGRILPAYPVFDRHLLDHDGRQQATTTPESAAPPSPDTYCAWAPRSAPGSPARDPAPALAPFPKSASTGEARRFCRLRGLVSGAAGRSHSDGKEKFVFLQPATTPSKMSGSKAAQAADGSSKLGTTKPSAPAQKQSKKKGAKSGAVTEMDMATAHKLFYGKQGALASDRRQQQQQSYLPYRPGIVGFFTTAHALGRSHHPY